MTAHGRQLPWELVLFAVFALLALAVPPLYGHYLPQRLDDYLIFGLPALAVGLIAGKARLLNIGVLNARGVRPPLPKPPRRHSIPRPSWPSRMNRLGPLRTGPNGDTTP